MSARLHRKKKKTLHNEVEIRQRKLNGYLKMIITKTTITKKVITPYISKYQNTKHIQFIITIQCPESDASSTVSKLMHNG